MANEKQNKDRKNKKSSSIPKPTNLDVNRSNRPTTSTSTSQPQDQGQQLHPYPNGSANHDTTNSSSPNTCERKDRTCCGTIETATIEARERRERRMSKPQPWIVRKILVPFTLGLLGFSAFAYIDRVCLEIIQGRSLVWGRGVGIALLSVFCVLYAWVLWAYAKAVLTSPGYAKHHVPKSERPQLPSSSNARHYYDIRRSYSTDGHTPRFDAEGSEYDAERERDRDLEANHRPPSSRSKTYAASKRYSGRPSSSRAGSRAGNEATSLNVARGEGRGRGLAGPSYEDLVKRDMERASENARTSSLLSAGASSPVAESAWRPAGYDVDVHLEKTQLAQHESVQTRTDKPHDHPDVDAEAGIVDSLTVPMTSRLKKPVPARLSTQPQSPSRSQRSQAPLSSSSPSPPSRLPSTHPTPSVLPSADHPATEERKTKQKSPARRRKQILTPERLAELDQLNVHRRPSTTPVLNPVHRYCSTDELVKPGRTHHCRSCGTCVLKYDHHCPWIGQCVGARNHKFFLNFCLIAAIYTAYVFSTTIAYTVLSNRQSSSFLQRVIDPLDPLNIVHLALSGLFFIFTVSLFGNHVHMTLKGQTTVESMHMRSLTERESAVMARGVEWWEVRVTREVRRMWDEEWGKPETEGNLWWRGSKWDEWVDVMGTSWWGWIFPVGRSQSDGLNYPVNPRFNEEGVLRKRRDWPEDLR